MRNIKFQVEEYYHIYNRGINKREIFTDENDYLRFIRNMKVFNKSKLSCGNPKLSCDDSSLVEFTCYCLNPNHYHFLIKQLEDKGIEKFMHKLGVGYSTYFNKKYNRSGSLFEGAYKAIYIKSNSYLIWLSAYINGNSEIHQIAKADNYQWSSYLEYINEIDNKICNKKEILDQFKDINEYKDSVNLVIEEAKSRKDEMKKYILE